MCKQYRACLHCHPWDVAKHGKVEDRKIEGGELGSTGLQKRFLQAASGKSFTVMDGRCLGMLEERQQGRYVPECWEELCGDHTDAVGDLSYIECLECTTIDNDATEHDDGGGHTLEGPTPEPALARPSIQDPPPVLDAVTGLACKSPSESDSSPVLDAALGCARYRERPINNADALTRTLPAWANMEYTPAPALTHSSECARAVLTHSRECEHSVLTHSSECEHTVLTHSCECE